MAKSYEDNFWQTIWEFLPGIIKFLSVIGIVLSLFNYFNLSALQRNNALVDNAKYDVSIRRSYNHIEGNEASKVTLVYFVDHQCPYCRTNQTVMTEVKSEYKDKALFVYKHFPLESIHVYAKTAAKAVQAAGKQGKYTEFSAKAFDLQDGNKFTGNNLEAIAKELNLDVEKWNQDRNSNLISQEIENDVKDLRDIELPANSSGVSKPGGQLANSAKEGLGTPFSILYKDGKVMDWWSGGLDSQGIKARLDKALE